MATNRRPALGLALLATVAVAALAADTRQAPGVTAGDRSMPAARSLEAQVARGERFYRRGIGVSGDVVAARVQGDLQLRSDMMPCTNCHRRSGWGTTEGPITTPPLVGPVLFEPVTLGNRQIGLRTSGPGTRPPYDEAALLRALRDGIGADGRVLSQTMPRYAVGPADGQAVTEYLRTLGATPPPGVTATTIHLATLVSDTVSLRARDAMLGVLRAFVNAKNAGTRYESRRRDQGPWDMKAHYELYRNWELHEWSLTGRPDDWPRQLTEHNARQPVFAIVAGLAEGDWAPIHEFCEREAVPCVFPLAKMPPDRGVESGFYSLYFSQGLALEASTLAKYLGELPASAGRRRMVQVVRPGSAGERAARRLTAALGPALAVETRTARGPQPPAADIWRQWLGGGVEIVVPWLDEADLAGLAEVASSPAGLTRVGGVYLSASLLGDGIDALPRPLREKSYLVDPFVSPDQLDRHAARTLVWLRNQKLDSLDRQVGANAFFAISAVGDALATPRAIGSREYFVEQIEHMVGRSPQRSAFPTLSLGAGRRFASLGCALLKVPPESGGSYDIVVPWFVPDVRSLENR